MRKTQQSRQNIRVISSFLFGVLIFIVEHALRRGFPVLKAPPLYKYKEVVRWELPQYKYTEVKEPKKDN